MGRSLEAGARRSLAASIASVAVGVSHVRPCCIELLWWVLRQ